MRKIVMWIKEIIRLINQKYFLGIKLMFYAFLG